MLKCSKEAFAACPDRKNCGCIEEAIFAEGSECDEFNRKIGRHTLTNADRIRAMSDEELACTMYAASGMDGETIGFCKNLPKCRDILNGGQLIPDEDCTACMLDWLRQPVKEESK